MLTGLGNSPQLRSFDIYVVVIRHAYRHGVITRVEVDLLLIGKQLVAIRLQIKNTTKRRYRTGFKASQMLNLFAVCESEVSQLKLLAISRPGLESI